MPVFNNPNTPLGTGEHAEYIKLDFVARVKEAVGLLGDLVGGIRDEEFTLLQFFQDATQYNIRDMDEVVKYVKYFFYEGNLGNDDDDEDEDEEILTEEFFDQQISLKEWAQNNR